MTYRENLERRAMKFWNRGQHLPTDLFAEMLNAGLDVSALEEKHMKEPV